jgi:hypothetical protein
MTGGEIALVLFIFGLIYVAGLLPKIATLLAGKPREPETASKE